MAENIRNDAATNDAYWDCRIPDGAGILEGLCRWGDWLTRRWSSPVGLREYLQKKQRKSTAGRADRWTSEKRAYHRKRCRLRSLWVPWTGSTTSTRTKGSRRPRESGRRRPKHPPDHHYRQHLRRRRNGGGDGPSVWRTPSSASWQRGVIVRRILSFWTRRRDGSSIPSR